MYAQTDEQPENIMPPACVIGFIEDDIFAHGDQE